MNAQTLWHNLRAACSRVGEVYGARRAQTRTFLRGSIAGTSSPWSTT